MSTVSRGTTPTHIFRLPFSCSNITKLNLAYSQNDKVVIEKDLSLCSLEDNKVTVTLTEADTLKLDCKCIVKVQMRVGCGDTRLVSKVLKRSVGEILKDGVLA